ncbi:MAG: hypothetical protein IJM67_05110 [Atopobiaceae bacterium]|nr:hypothetical protein [Atopobiaceae bacterium]
MRYDTDTALRELVARGALIRQRRERRVTQILTGLSLTCGALLVACFMLLIPDTPADAPMAAYGAFLLPGEAGGYVLAGVIAFALGVAFAVICVRSRNMFGNDRVVSNEDLVEDVKKDGTHV